MRRITLGLVLALACATAVAAQAVSIGDARFDFGNEALRPRTDAQKKFVADYLAAVASKSVEAVRDLVHPASLACITNDTNREYLRQLHERDTRRDIPTNARIIIQPFTDPVTIPFVPTGLTQLPVKPTDVFGIDYNWDKRDVNGVIVRHIGVTVLRALAPHEGRLMLAEYCLTTKGEEIFREKQRAMQTPSESPARK